MSFFLSAEGIVRRRQEKSDDEHKSEPFAHVTRSLPVDYKFNETLFQFSLICQCAGANDSQRIRSGA